MLENVRSEVRDLSDFDATATERVYDLVLTFDAIHDQAQPLKLQQFFDRSDHLRRMTVQSEPACNALDLKRQLGHVEQMCGSQRATVLRIFGQNSGKMRDSSQEAVTR